MLPVSQRTSELRRQEGYTETKRVVTDCTFPHDTFWLVSIVEGDKVVPKNVEYVAPNVRHGPKRPSPGTPIMLAGDAPMQPKGDQAPRQRSGAQHVDYHQRRAGLQPVDLRDAVGLRQGLPPVRTCNADADADGRHRAQVQTERLDRREPRPRHEGSNGHGLAACEQLPPDGDDPCRSARLS